MRNLLKLSNSSIVAWPFKQVVFFDSESCHRMTIGKDHPWLCTICLHNTGLRCCNKLSPCRLQTTVSRYWIHLPRLTAVHATRYSFTIFNQTRFSRHMWSRLMPMFVGLHRTT